MSKYEDENKIWDKLRASLQEHEESYQEGAWEKFQAYEKKNATKSHEDVIPPVIKMTSTQGRKSSLYFWMSGVAAALLLMAGAWLLWPSNDLDFNLDPTLVSAPISAPVTAPSSDPTSDPSSDPTSDPLSNPTSRTILESSPKSITASASHHAAIISESSTEEVPRNIQASIPAAMVLHADISMDHQQVRAEKSALEFPQPNYVVASASASFEEERDIEKKPEYLLSRIGPPVTNPWQFGLQVNSAVTTDRLNYGGGLQVAYRLSEKVSIRSGLSVGKMGLNRAKDQFFGHVASRLKGESVDILQIENKAPNDGIYSYPGAGPQGSANPIKGLNASMTPSYHYRTLLGTTSEVVSIDIPIEVKINWTRNFYSSVGVSFVGIVNENRYNYYSESYNTNLRLGISDMSHVPQNLQYQLHTETVKNVSDVHPLEGKQFATGYFNMSIGRQIPIAGNFRLGLEPFVKLPMGNLRRSDMNFTNVGVRLVSGF